MPIASVRLPSSAESEEPADISREFVDHWVAVFGDTSDLARAEVTPDAASQQKLLDSRDRRLSEPQRQALNESVTAADLTASIKHMQSHSSPGLDGFTAASYRIDPMLLGRSWK